MFVIICVYCGAAAVRGHHLGGNAEVIRQVRRDYALGYKLWFYDFFVNMRKWVWKCAKYILFLLDIRKIKQ